MDINPAGDGYVFIPGDRGGRGIIDLDTGHFYVFKSHRYLCAYHTICGTPEIPCRVQLGSGQRHAHHPPSAHSLAKHQARFFLRLFSAYRGSYFNPAQCKSLLLAHRSRFGLSMAEAQVLWYHFLATCTGCGLGRTIFRSVRLPITPISVEESHLAEMLSISYEQTVFNPIARLTRLAPWVGAGTLSPICPLSWVKSSLGEVPIRVIRAHQEWLLHNPAHVYHFQAPPIIDPPLVNRPPQADHPLPDNNRPQIARTVVLRSPDGQAVVYDYIWIPSTNPGQSK